jgi:hypothetical protein
MVSLSTVNAFPYDDVSFVGDNHALDSYEN